MSAAGKGPIQSRKSPKAAAGRPAKPGPAARSRAVAVAMTKAAMHPRNRHLQGYDFAALCHAAPWLSRHLMATPDGTTSLDFADPAAVKALNRALLARDYGIREWDIPAGHLCPPVPGRVDYLHHLADLLAAGNDGEIPRGPAIRVLDIGVGANCIFPLLGHAEYGWRFLGSDIDAAALDHARAIVAANGLGKAIGLRHQPVADNVFSGLLRSGEHYDLSLCNPPFHNSPGEADAAARRKWNQLGKHQTAKGGGPHLNFGGQGAELWCPGGERAFLQILIEQSAGIPKRVLWFSSLVSKADNLGAVEAALAKVHPRETRIIPMAQGQKQSRLVAWTFCNTKEREKWRRSRWAKGEPGEGAAPPP